MEGEKISENDRIKERRKVEEKENYASWIFEHHKFRFVSSLFFDESQDLQ